MSETQRRLLRLESKIDMAYSTEALDRRVTYLNECITAIVNYLGVTLELSKLTAIKKEPTSGIS
jgi:hypothetical protein